MTAEQLRNSILQQAISGRLVPQDPNDEPASALLAQIREEKAQLIKAGKLKKEKPSAPITEDEIPFEIPASWEWVRFFTVYNLETNLVNPQSYHNYQHIAPDNIEKKSGRLLQCKTVKEDNVKSNNHLFSKGQLIYSKIRPLLRKAVIAPFDGLCSADMYPLSTSMYIKYALLYLLSDVFNSQVSAICSSRVKMPKINQEELSTIIVPLPPLAEQQRIVAKLEELLPIVEQYGKAQAELDELNAALPARLRQSILQQAIQGKLVPQDPNEGTAESILKKYGVNVLDSEEELPCGWSLVRMGDLTEFINGMAFKPEDWKEQGLPIVRIQNLSNPNQPIHYTNQEIPEKFIIDNGQLLFSWSATLDAFIWNRGKACLNQHIFKLVPQPFIDKIYLFYLLKAIVEEYKKVTHGSTMKHITKGIFENYEVMLPPLAEQKRIVAKIEELFAEIEKLK